VWVFMFSVFDAWLCPWPAGAPFRLQSSLDP
jgi:hypothetical protein